MVSHVDPGYAGRVTESPAPVSIEVRRAQPSDIPACHEIRRRVFIDEQRVPEDEEMDDLDAASTHLIACRDGRAIGTARLRSVDGDAKAERVAVLSEQREHGVGRLLMQHLEVLARARGLQRMVLNAQVNVIPFYERLGYVAEGERFLDAGIPHRRMTKPLNPPSR